jgi:hypothetical protein
MPSSNNTFRQWCLVAVLLFATCEAFVGPLPKLAQKSSFALSGVPNSDKLSAAAAAGNIEEPKVNPNYPNLPAVKGDFDWDAKFGGDDDWITENVPGKGVLNEVALAQQVTAMNKLEEKWRKTRAFAEYEEEKKVGFVGKAEVLNGRFAMFFIVTGLLTEAFTGVSFPGQVEELLRIGGFIGFE